LRLLKEGKWLKGSGRKKNPLVLYTFLATPKSGSGYVKANSLLHFATVK
jgi:hypothetical protein